MMSQMAEGGGGGGGKSNPQSPLIFTPANESQSTLAEEKSLELAIFEKEIDRYIGNLESLGARGIERPPTTADIGMEALTGDPYPGNKDEGEPANDIKENKKGPFF